eukprot:CAMPEP_0114654166 /NCGR_PEP_ID=MMETSP0191-20121206/10289_1 /TAXON_ID=126664 /ORGANISM="Sorites sp." /LENGTH=47 /DNA_ID= /DNA_START= /DNA_END= /DNA_ORIENTATION=
MLDQFRGKMAWSWDKQAKAARECLEPPDPVGSYLPSVQKNSAMSSAP